MFENDVLHFYHLYDSDTAAIGVCDFIANNLIKYSGYKAFTSEQHRKLTWRVFGVLNKLVWSKR